MREKWNLPNESKFCYTGKDWLQLLLSQTDAQMKASILLLLWRSWYLRNDVIHNEGKESIASSVAFLQALGRDLLRPPQVLSDPKGKGVQEPGGSTSTRPIAGPLAWSAPPTGWVKLNTDGSLPASSDIGGAGAVVRDSNGSVIFAACANLPNCRDAEEAEGRAALLGLQAVARLGLKNVILEMDNVASTAVLKAKTQDRSRCCFIYEEAKKILFSLDGYIVTHSKRDTNRVADALAKLAFSLGKREMTDVLPISVRELVMIDSNNCMPS